MIYTEAIKGGFRLINKRWQLVGVQAAVMLMNCLGFFIMVGIPLGIAFIIFGLDLTGLTEVKDLLGVFKNPAELLSKYFGLVLLVVASFFFYILVVTTVGLYIFSGSIGVIGRGILDPESRFSLKGFFAEAKRHFFPLMWFSLVVGLAFIVIAFILGLFVGGIVAVVDLAKSQDSTLALFLGIFFSLVMTLLACSLLLGALAATVYGIAVLFFKGEGAFRSFRSAVEFLWKNPNGFWLYSLLFIFYILASFLVMLVVYPFNLIPIIGTIISFPFQILSYIVQGYLGLVIIAVVFNYYFEMEMKKNIIVSQPGESDVLLDSETAIGAGSTPVEDISVTQVPLQETPPQASEQS